VCDFCRFLRQNLLTTLRLYECVQVEMHVLGPKNVLKCIYIIVYTFRNKLRVVTSNTHTHTQDILARLDEHFAQRSCFLVLQPGSLASLSTRN